MSVDAVSELLKMAISEGFVIMLPIAAGALIVGLIIGILQTVTSIQEQTLTFVPKLAAAALLIYLLGPWMLQRLGTMTVTFFQRAGEVLR